MKNVGLEVGVVPMIVSGILGLILLRTTLVALGIEIIFAIF